MHELFSFLLCEKRRQKAAALKYPTYSQHDLTISRVQAGKQRRAFRKEAFNLLCAPCFAAMGAIRREMNSTKWFLGAIGYQCGLAYQVGLVIYQISSLLSGGFGIGTVAAIVVIVLFFFLLLRPSKKAEIRRSTLAVDAR